MEIDALTDTPQQLVEAINKAITDGKLRTWKKGRNSKGRTVYAHNRPQWVDKAIIKPFIYKDRVIFKISWWKKNGEPSIEVKGYILGRFTEILMVHFRNYFTKLELSVYA